MSPSTTEPYRRRHGARLSASAGEPATTSARIAPRRGRPKLRAYCSRARSSSRLTPSDGRALLPNSTICRTTRLTVSEGTAADADVAARAARREDHRVDADEPAARVKERSARVARVDCGVRLDAVFDRPSAVAVDVPAEGGDDARRQGVVEAERIADGQHVLADAQRGGGGGDLQRLQRPQPRRVHLEHRQVLVRLMPDDRRLNLPLDALQRDHHSRLGRLARDWVGDNVIVGDDVAVGVPDKARASAGLNNAPRREDRGRDEGDGGRGVLKHGHTSRLPWREERWCVALIGLSPPAHRVGIVREGDWLWGSGYDEAGSERHNTRVVNGRLEGRRHGCCVARSCCGRESGQATCCRRVGQATCCRREWHAADV
mmetsp:Transcript_3736/g.10942  ORF Transcript_3736/g.10942 Transcript_3736/m.10942 type:complete len:374 (+) Transcript_3736:1267-2388(+)